ncbi:type VII secretion protein EccB [Streptomyces sp. 6N223]|uniref:type VII secretion protein EccB n=1 Tax=Streptomyces sp. 6N223 TaxID=3457412 RepID=UPI003FD66E75
MATTREQSEAYSYANRRMSTSLLRGTDEARFDPRRRLNRGLGAGIAIGVLIMAVFGIVGWLGGGRGPGLPNDGAVVVGESSFVVVDGVVHPALNHASALLASDGEGDATEVREGTLNDAPRGPRVGIPDAPDALPDADDLLDDTWTLCATPAENVVEPTDTALYVSVPGVPTGDAESGGETLLVQTEDDRLWLLTEGRRYLIDSTVQVRLELRQEPVRLPSQIIATVPEGPKIEVPGLGSGIGDRPSVELPLEEMRVGDVVHTYEDGAARQHYLVRPDGLLPITPLVYALLSYEDTTGGHRISLAQAEDAPEAGGEIGDEAWPEEVPVAADPERAQPVCISTPPGSEPGDTPWQATVHLPQTMPAPEDAQAITAADFGKLGLLDAIYMPPGSGAVVRAVASGGRGGTYTLITDSGTAFEFISSDAVLRLGYDPTVAPAMPTAYVNLLPTGPKLDPAEAVKEQPGESQ